MTDYKKVVEGKGGIVARIVADSVYFDTTGGNIMGAELTYNKFRITTFEIEYPRWILAEINTHRALSRNSASSRAIPTKRMIQMIKERPAMPIHWGKNQPGMSAKEESDAPVGRLSREAAWMEAAKSATFHVKKFEKAGYHKQFTNRLIENFTFPRTVVTATEWDNFFYLRNHPDAQPEFQELARCMYEAYSTNEPVKLKTGDWHMPYYEDGAWLAKHTPKQSIMGGMAPIILPESFGVDLASTTPLEDALAISSSCCAQVSYRRLDDTLEKAKQIMDRLVTSKPAHSSPMEHQATPMPVSEYNYDQGVTHFDVKGNLWSANFKGWIQHRQLIPGNTCWQYPA